MNRLLESVLQGGPRAGFRVFGLQGVRLVFPRMTRYGLVIDVYIRTERGWVYYETEIEQWNRP